MDLVTVFRIAIRRWYVFLPTLILCCLTGFIASSQVAPGYEVAGVLVVNTPYVTTEAESAAIANNSYSDTRSTASVLGGVAASADTANAIATSGGYGAFQAIVQEGRPLIHVSVVATSREDALVTYRLLVAELAKRLDGIQAAKQVPPPARVSLDDVVNPQEPLQTNGSRLKVLLAAVGLGTILAFGLAVLADYRGWGTGRLLRKRDAKRAKGDEQEREDEIPARQTAPEPDRPAPRTPPAQAQSPRPPAVPATNHTPRNGSAQPAGAPSPAAPARHSGPVTNGVGQEPVPQNGARTTAAQRPQPVQTPAPRPVDDAPESRPQPAQAPQRQPAVKDAPPLGEGSPRRPSGWPRQDHDQRDHSQDTVRVSPVNGGDQPRQAGPR